MSLPINQVINGDCLEVMRGFPDKSVDLVLTDPPYGVDVASMKKGGRGGERAKKRNELGCYDDSAIGLKDLIAGFLPQAIRVSKCVAVCAGIKTLMYYPQPDWILAWVYENKSNFCPYGFNNWTPILCYGKDPFQQKRRGNAPLAVKTDIIYDNIRPKKNGHPTPKPISFMEKLVERLSTSKDDIILDPFAGSGTTLVAAKQNKRNYIGIEISEKYCEIARKRVESTTVKLF